MLKGSRGRPRGSPQNRLARKIDRRFEDVDIELFQRARIHRLVSPEQILQSAVMEQAIHDLRSQRADLREEAITYLSQNDRSGPFTFATICDALGINQGAARRALFRGR